MIWLEKQNFRLLLLYIKVSNHSLEKDNIIFSEWFLILSSIFSSPVVFYFLQNRSKRIKSKGEGDV
ncbi:MAG TPA: hypothetical protein DCW97_00120 [Acidobacteria bacterium]|nr:hypothetical protein [Acidobacteriota bacterium]